MRRSIPERAAASMACRSFGARLSATDNALALGHRAVLDNLIDLGYEHEAIEEIEGCCSAAGVGDDKDLDTPATRSPGDCLS